MPKTDLATLRAVVAGTLIGDGGTVVSDVVHDSRQANTETLFVAIRGFASDGHDFVSLAAKAGAPAVCVIDQQAVPVPQLKVADTRAALPHLAAAVHGYPSTHLDVVGVTGTNGKTTVTHMLESIVLAAGRISGVVGTIGARSAGVAIPLERTTPEASDIQRLLARMVADGVEVVSMEVSSHALALGRADAIRFSVAAFTNLSVDHLDFHSDIYDYFEAKARLFDMAQAKVIHTGGWGDELAIRHPDALLVGPGGTVTAQPVEATSAGSRFRLETPEGIGDVTLSLAGDFNIANALVAAGCALVLDLPLAAIVSGLGAVAAVPGRMERITSGAPFEVFVDYAHTPEGVEVAIAAARGFTTGRVIVVVGAGGDRDRSKRPLMGQAAAAADEVWITSDNPRSENPDAIIADVLAGLPTTTEPEVEPDRAQAIAGAIEAARPGDTVLILGKGHEQGQERQGVIAPFDDRLVAAEALAGSKPA